MRLYFNMGLGLKLCLKVKGYAMNMYGIIHQIKLISLLMMFGLKGCMSDIGMKSVICYSLIVNS